MAIETIHPGLPKSILDTDLYKFTMQQALLQLFPNDSATYAFTCRDKTIRFSKKSIDIFISTVSHFKDLILTPTERKWLAETCPYLTPSYLDYLSAYRFNPAQVDVEFRPTSDDGEWGIVEMVITGPWVETILWEVPLMHCLSEIYFNTVDTDWCYDGQADVAYHKGSQLKQGGCMFTEFGTRRRRSYRTQDIVIESLLRAVNEVSGTGKMTGTSNVHFAQKYNVLPMGTMAHEWFMGIAALTGYEGIHHRALELWEQVYNDTNLIALTDTFSSQAFFNEFTKFPAQAHKWQGVRQDSGDPYDFGIRAKQAYESLGIDPATKVLVYSDALDIDKVLSLQEFNKSLGFKVSYGIGTNLTNDFQSVSSGLTGKSKALNMVIKLASVNGQFCAKISDDVNKNTGDPATVEHVKRMFNLPGGDP